MLASFFLIVILIFAFSSFGEVFHWPASMPEPDVAAYFTEGLT